MRLKLCLKLPLQTLCKLPSDAFRRPVHTPPTPPHRFRRGAEPGLRPGAPLEPKSRPYLGKPRSYQTVGTLGIREPSSPPGAPLQKSSRLPRAGAGHDLTASSKPQFPRSHDRLSGQSRTRQDINAFSVNMLKLHLRTPCAIG